MVANATIDNQQRLQDRLTKERDRDRRADDQFYAEVLAHLEKLQPHRRETEHHRAGIQGNPKTAANSCLNTQDKREHENAVPQGQKPLSVPMRSSPRSDFVSGQVDLKSSIGVCGNLRNVSECSRGCQCSCHVRQRLNTPRLLDEFLGTLFIGYSGSPLIQRCNQKPCRGRKDSSTTFTYQFPQWFITSRMIQLKAKVTALYGPELSLRFNRVVGGKALIFHYATTGDVSKMKHLFEQGRASPSDVRFDSGLTPLHVSVLEEIDLDSDVELLLTMCDIVCSPKQSGRNLQAPPASWRRPLHGD